MSLLPGGSAAHHFASFARTVTRRAERLVACLMKENHELSHLPLRYFNRLYR
ncbi:hypothetical protein EWI07_05065 [Sporolactobacillus sp. THM7-4]|nr:hypothetical protein EWI07_05065 [Sporolactobacillus sp. THM7-4]